MSDVGPLMSQPSTLSRILGLWVAEIAGACVGAVVGHAYGFGETGFIVGLTAGGLVHILLRSRSD